MGAPVEKRTLVSRIRAVGRTLKQSLAARIKAHAEAYVAALAVLVSVVTFWRSHTLAEKLARYDQVAKRFEYARALHEREQECEGERSCPLDNPTCGDDEAECPPRNVLPVRQAALRGLIEMATPDEKGAGGRRFTLLENSRVPWGDLRNMKLADLSFYGADLRCAMFEGVTTFENTLLRFTDLRGASFDCKKDGCAVAAQLLAKADWQGRVVCPDGTFIERPGERCSKETLIVPERYRATCAPAKDPLCTVVKDGRLVETAFRENSKAAGRCTFKLQRSGSNAR